jgi:ubiquinone biosynthesis protein UbiJ
MPATPVWLAAVESVLNRSIDRSEKAQGLARRLNQTSLEVDIEGVTRIRAAVYADRLALTRGGETGADAADAAGAGAAAAGAAGAGAGAAAADAGTRADAAQAVISGSPFALLRLLAGGAGGGSGPTPDRSRAAARVVGDAEVAARYRELFSLARPDLEEELSRLVGDLPARRLSLAAQGAVGWVGKLGRTARENLAEYLQEESRDLAAKAEVEEFVRGVDGLRDTAERVEARLARIEERLKTRP